MTKVYLTKSSEVAYALAHGFGYDMTNNTNGIKNVSAGFVADNVRISAIYHNKDYFYCAVEMNPVNSTEPDYNLIIA